MSRVESFVKNKGVIGATGLLIGLAGISEGIATNNHEIAVVREAYYQSHDRPITIEEERDARSEVANIKKAIQAELDRQILPVNFSKISELSSSDALKASEKKVEAANEYNGARDKYVSDNSKNSITGLAEAGGGLAGLITFVATGILYFNEDLKKKNAKIDTATA